MNDAVTAAQGALAAMNRLGRHLDNLQQRVEDRAFTARAARLAYTISFDRSWNDSVQRQRKQLAETQAAADAFYRRGTK
ncbi:hypothetical protein FF100_22360 [Methylobacterium terricola]|uniref:Uncharacterized protein n=1 Tax=Methylobacterium terricola TaxID=2583531 RepID=A0A5C4LEH9_9HYPH|nr:hypothetical protein [Methylobacterium terricola]TNC10418.1 hypothetical protein FF100_22360 [Methylobacterium terricola]